MLLSEKWSDHAPRPRPAPTLRTPRSELRFRDGHNSSDLRARSPRRQLGERRHRNHALLITNPLKETNPYL